MKKDLAKNIQSKSIRDYTYAVMFLLVASFFAFAVIRPVLGIAISIRRQGEDLRRINALYERNITRVLELQSQLEEIRPKRYLLDDALPEQAQINGLITDIQTAAGESGVTIVSIQIDPIILRSQSVKKEKGKSAKKKATQPADVDNVAQTIGASMKVTASYESVQAFLQALLNQRRVKQVESVQLTVDKKRKDSDLQNINLHFQAEMETYYVQTKGKL